MDFYLGFEGWVGFVINLFFGLRSYGSFSSFSGMEGLGGGDLG